MMARMNDCPCCNGSGCECCTGIAADVVSVRWRKYDADPDLSAAQKLDAIGADRTELMNVAAALRALAADVLAGSTAEAVGTRVQTAAARKAADGRRFRTGAVAVERRVDVAKAAADLDRERRSLEKAERAFASLERAEGLPGGELLIAQGAMEMQRARVAEAERVLAAATSRT